MDITESSFESSAVPGGEELLVAGGVGEEFRPAHEVFGTSELDYLDHLEAQGGDAAQAALARQSLYVRFDPLVDSAGMTAHVPALGKSFPVGSDLLVLDTPEKVQAYRSALAARKGAAVATPTSSTSSAGQPDADVVMTTPIGQMQPAATEDLLMNTPRPVSHKPNMIHAVQDAQTACENTQQDHVASSPTHVPFSSSYTESSPMAVEAALPPDVGHSRHKHVSVSSSPLSLPKSSPTTPPVVNAQSSGAPTSDLIDVLKYSEADIQRHVSEAVAAALGQLHAEGRQSAEESLKRIEELATENRSLQEKVTSDDQQLRELRLVIDDYNATMSRTKEQSRSKKDSLQHEIEVLSAGNSQMMADINSLENSFADLHNRYERMRAVNDTMRKDELALQEAERQLREEVEKATATNQRLKEHAAEQVNEANVKMQRIVHDHRSEVTILTANMKTLQVKVDSLERSLKQKEEENKELTTICEDMMKQMRPL